jgi:hypothetical protein
MYAKLTIALDSKTSLLARQGKPKGHVKRRHLCREAIPKLQVGSLMLYNTPSAAQRTKLYNRLAYEGPHAPIDKLGARP